MTAKKNNVGSKEFKVLVQKATKAYEQINKQECKIGENMFNLGKTLDELKKENNKHKYYSSFDILCEECFAFSRQYGYRKIKFYNIQRKLHEKGLLKEGTYLSNSMLLTLMRAKNPCKVWEEACREAEGEEPSEKLIRQIIDRDNPKTEESNDSLKNEIAQATADKIISVLQKIKNKNYSPYADERKQLIALLEASWDQAAAESATGCDDAIEQTA